MSTKLLVFLGMTIGGIIGGYIPVLFGAGLLSYTSVLTSGIGAILGIIVANKISDF